VRYYHRLLFYVALTWFGVDLWRRTATPGAGIAARTAAV